MAGRGGGSDPGEICPHDLSRGAPWVIGDEAPRVYGTWGSPGGGLQPLPPPSLSVLPALAKVPVTCRLHSCFAFTSPDGIFLSLSFRGPAGRLVLCRVLKAAGAPGWTRCSPPTGNTWGHGAEPDVVLVIPSCPKSNRKELESARWRGACVVQSVKRLSLRS